MPRFAANLTMLFTERPLAERFAAARAAGFAAVEVLFPYELPPEALADLAADADVTVVLINAPPGDWTAGERGLAALAGRRAAFRASIDRALAYARAASVPRLHVMSGVAPPGAPEAEHAWSEAMAWAADRLGEAGLDLLLEPLNSRDMPGYFLDEFDRTMDRIERLGRPNVRLQFDIYHRQILRGDVLTGLHALLPWIGHVQIASVPARTEPGTGELDDFRILAALDQAGYSGYVGCEYRPRTRTEAGLGWLAQVARQEG